MVPKTRPVGCASFALGGDHGGAAAGAAGRFTSEQYVRALGQTVFHSAGEGDVGGSQPNVLLHGLNDLQLVEETLDQTWSRFSRPSTGGTGVATLIRVPTPTSSAGCMPNLCLFSAMRRNCSPERSRI